MGSSLQLTISSESLRRFESDMSKYKAKTHEKISKAIYKSGNAILNKSKIMAPRDTSVLAGSYSMRPNNKFSVNVGSDLLYAPYAEFGTGRKVANYRFFDKIKGLREYALTFKKGGNRNKKPTAHLFRAVFLERNNFERRIRKALENG